MSNDAKAEPRRYTLDEARRMIAAEQCAVLDHEPRIEGMTHVDGEWFCECRLVSYIRVTTATEAQLAGEEP